MVFPRPCRASSGEAPVRLPARLKSRASPTSSGAGALNTPGRRVIIRLSGTNVYALLKGGARRCKCPKYSLPSLLTSRGHSRVPSAWERLSRLFRVLLSAFCFSDTSWRLPHRRETEILAFDKFPTSSGTQMRQKPPRLTSGAVPTSGAFRGPWEPRPAPPEPPLCIPPGWTPHLPHSSCWQ